VSRISAVGPQPGGPAPASIRVGVVDGVRGTCSGKGSRDCPVTRHPPEMSERDFASPRTGAAISPKPRALEVPDANVTSGL
jgi:hypothetical protein